MSIEQNKEIVRRFQEGQWISRDLEMVDQLVDPDTPLAGMTWAKWKDVLRDYHKRLPELTFKIEELIGEGDTVVSRWVFRGNHTHELPTAYGPAAPTGKEFTFKGISIIRVRNGKIVDEIVQADDLGYLQQLGVIPTPGKST